MPTIEQELEALAHGASLKNVLARRVEAGVEFLDKNEPGWRSEIVIKKFDIRSRCNCVVGQVFGIPDYDNEDGDDPDDYIDELTYENLVVQAIVGSTNSGSIYAEEYGFDWDLRLRKAGFDTEEQYITLQALWMAELSK